MGWDIYIGEAKLDPGDSEDLRCRVTVDCMSHPEAPVAPGDSMTANGNSRHPGYGQWTDFVREVGLYDLFLAKDDEPQGLMSEHPGCFRIEASHHAQIAAALAAWTSSHPGKVPGWDPNLKGVAAFTGEGADPKYDGNLARLIWLEWWFRWALANCTNPAIYNR